MMGGSGRGVEVSIARQGFSLCVTGTGQRRGQSGARHRFPAAAAGTGD